MAAGTGVNAQGAPLHLPPEHALVSTQEVMTLGEQRGEHTPLTVAQGKQADGGTHGMA